MSQSVVKIVSPSSTVNTFQNFSIAVKEVGCRNCSWETNIPQGILLVSSTSSRVHPDQLQEWVFVAEAPGTYIIKLTYRKRCCGKPIVQREFFTIIVK